VTARLEIRSLVAVLNLPAGEKQETADSSAAAA